METAIRWASSSTTAEQRFLLVDVNGRTFRHCRVISYDENDLPYDVLTTHRKVPPFRAFDWSRDETLVAVGQWSGEATILRLDNESQVSSLPIKNQRLCNAVAFGTSSLLATGLERVRNDFCLNIWDISRGAPSSSLPSSPRPISGRSTIEPVRKLASSEGITSIKFFEQSDILVAGVKGTCIRIYDLRENTGNPSLQVQTGCVHNIAIDALDDNYFAAAAPAKDSTIQIWDRRVGLSSSASLIGAGLDHHSQQHGPALEFRKAFDEPNGASQATIWSLKYCKSQRGCLGALASTGNYKFFQTKKQYASRASIRTDQNTFVSENGEPHAEPLYTKRIFYDVYPFAESRPEAPENTRIVSFDFTNLGGRQGRPCAITQHNDQSVGIHELSGPCPALSLSSSGGLAIGRDISITLSPNSTASETGLSNVMKLVFPSEKTSIAQSLQRVRTKRSTAKRRQSDTKTHISSRDAHEKLCSPQKLGNLKDALTLSTVLRRRCVEGYLFSCKRNAEIVSDDPWLQEMWTWIGRAKGNAADGGMMAGGVDLSFLGISGIWNHELGSQKAARIHDIEVEDQSYAKIVELLATSLQLPAIDLENTLFPYHRQVCLHTCGLALDNQQLEAMIKDLAHQGHSTRAALLAVAHDDYKLASSALRGDKTVHRELSLALAGFGKGNTDVIWDETIRDIAKGLDDAHGRAILALVSHGDWHDVLDVTSLPLKDRIMVALLHLNDQELGQYFRVMQEECIREGDIEGIVLTGLTEHAVPLFEAYIRKFSDAQTPVLALSFTSPRYFVHPIVDTWREAYRSQLNMHRLFLQRVQFDIQATKLSVHPNEKSSKPLLASTPRQVSLRCNTCDQALDRSSDNMPKDNLDPTTFNSSQRTSIFGDVKSGTVCPKCGRHMPRCVICMMWLGMPDSHGKGAVTTAATTKQPIARSMESPAPKTNKAKRKEELVNPGDDKNAEDLMKDFIVVCKACWHMSHGSHAQEWFRGHDVCAVPGCDCRCALSDGVSSAG